MTAEVYPSIHAEFHNGTFDWLADEIRVILLGPGFVPDTSQQYVDSIQAQYIIAESDPLENRTVDQFGRVFSYPAAFLQLFNTQLITTAVLYQDTGDPAYSPLIAYFNGDNLLGSPLLSEGLDQFVHPDAIYGWLSFTAEEELVGEIGDEEMAGDATPALGEVLAALAAPTSVLLLSSRLTVTTQQVCATPDEPEDCSPPRIRSSKCE